MGQSRMRMIFVGLYFVCFIRVATALKPSRQWISPRILQLDSSSLEKKHSSLLSRRNTTSTFDENSFCESDSFKMTTANFEEARVGQFYLDFINEAKEKHPTEYSELTAPNFFAQYAWGEQNFNCHIKSAGCSRLPSCSEIAKGLRNLHPDKVFDVGDMTRKIYFAVLTMDNLARYFGTIHAILSEVLAKVGLRVDSIVNDFTPMASPFSNHICKLVLDYYTMIFQIEVGLIASKLPDPFNAIVPAIANGIKTIITDGAEMAMEARHEYLNGFGDVYQDKKPLRFTLPQDYTHGICSIVFKDFAIDPVGRAGNLRDYISKEFQKLGNVVSKQWDFLNHPSRFRQDLESNSTMAVESIGMGFWMDQGDWEETNLSIDLDIGNFEDNMIQAFIDTLINTVWRSDRCSVKCQVDAGKETRKCDASRAKKHHDIRFCPDKTTICQVQCQTVHRGVGNVEKELFGRDKLRKHDLSIQSVLESSWQNYHDNGFYESNILDFANEVVHYNHSKVALPVCMSKYTKIADFVDRNPPAPLTEWLRRGIDQQMACSCGDWRSNETSLYMSALGLEPGSRDWLNGNMNEMMISLCPYVLRDLNPVNRFLAFCELGIRWPRKGEKFRPHFGTDARCDAVKAQVKDLSEGEANIYFCKHMPERNQIFSKELGHIDTAGVIPMPVSHKKRCHWFMEKGPGKGKTMETIGW